MILNNEMQKLAVIKSLKESKKKKLLLLIFFKLKGIQWY